MTGSSWERLRIPPEKKRAETKGPTILLASIVVFFIAAIAIVWWQSRANSGQARTPVAAPVDTASRHSEDTGVVLTVSGYVVPRERIEISPRFQGTVAWIGVKKGDAVRKGDVLVRLEDDEYRARLAEAEARVARAEASLEFARANFRRAESLRTRDVAAEQEFDAALHALRTAEAELNAAVAARNVARLQLEWCTICAPIDGVILEKLVNPNELVTPVNFGGQRGPSTAFLAMADLNDLQVEIDLNEVDTPKVFLGQRCRVSPEAYPDKVYDGFVAEIAPEANRSKGTLQIKVQVIRPDRHLTPELSARVEFLRSSTDSPSADEGS